MNVAPSPIGLGLVLFVVFLVLKLAHQIDWSWLWVTSPLWIVAVLVVLSEAFSFSRRQ